MLFRSPDQLRQIVADPKLIPAAVDEILRYEPPGPQVARYVNKDVEVYGQTVPKGSTMLFIIASGNRDERRYTDSERFDIHRHTRSHLVFGYGIHTCIGAALARIEGRVALEEIVKRFPEWEVDYENAELMSTSTVRGWDALPVFTTPGSRPARPRTDAPKVERSEKAAPVSIEGKWNLTIKSPTGPQATTLVLQRSGDVLTGTQSGQGMSSPISDVRLEGNNLTWKNEVTKPMKLKLEFTAAIDGNTLSGKVKAGFMGSYSFTGVKE